MSGYIYLAHSEGRGLKIGYSNDPVSRLKAVAADTGSVMTLLHYTEPMDDPRPVEAMAHWLLRDTHLGGELFSADEATARKAIETAIRMVREGEQAPQRINNATPFADLKDARVTMVAPGDWIRRIDDWRCRQKRIPSRSEAIRLLVDRALEADA